VIKMSQSKLVDYITDKYAIEHCPKCLKPLTPYWHTVLIEPYEDSDKAVLTQERKCDNCDYTEQTQVEQLKSIVCQGSKEDTCFICVKGCKGGCK